MDIRERLDDIEERFEWDEVVHTEIRRHQYDGQFQRWCRTAFVIGAIATLGGQFAASLSSGGTVAYVGQVFAVGGAVLLFGGALMYTFIRILVRKDEHFQSFKDFHETHAGNHPGE